LAMAFVEGLNWFGWLVKRNLALRSNSVVSRPELDPLDGIDLFFPDAWSGLVLGVGLLFVAYRLHAPSPCASATYSSTPGRYVGGALILAYGLLLLVQACLDLAWKFGRARPN